MIFQEEKVFVLGVFLRFIIIIILFSLIVWIAIISYKKWRKFKLSKIKYENSKELSEIAVTYPLKMWILVTKRIKKF